MSPIGVGPGGGVTLTPAILASIIGSTEGEATRLMNVAVPLVERYAPDAPSEVRDEAVIRVAGALYEGQDNFGGKEAESIGPKTVNYTPSPAGGISHFRRSGAMALLSPYRKRRAK